MNNFLKNFGIFSVFLILFCGANLLICSYITAKMVMKVVRENEKQVIQEVARQLNKKNL